MYAADVLQEAGFEVLEAGDAKEALRLMEVRPDIRILFTDIQMPGPLNGIELARKVHEQWPNVLLLITSGDQRPLESDIPDHGHFVAKPYGARQVVNEIGALAREEPQRR
jgi:DNA-binding response OmpR family regulator